jgi:hypothetical protein
VDLVKVDVVEAEALQAAIYAGENVRPREADLIEARANSAAYLGGDHDLFAGPIQRCERIADESFTFTFRVHIGCINEIYAGIESRGDQCLRLFFAEATNGLPHAAPAAECHGAEAELRDVQSCFAK